MGYTLPCARSSYCRVPIPPAPAGGRAAAPRTRSNGCSAASTSSPTAALQTPSRWSAAPCGGATNCSAQGPPCPGPTATAAVQHCGAHTSGEEPGPARTRGDSAVKHPPVCRTSEKHLPGSRCPEEQCRRQQGKWGQPKVKELNVSFGDLGSNPYTAAKFPVLLFKSLIPTLVKNSH